MRFEEIPHNLVEQARNGQSDALEEFCMMVQPDAYAVLMSLLRNTDDAADALQESMIRIIRYLPNLRDVNALPAWLMRMLTNQANDMRRRTAQPIIDITALDENTAAANVASTSSAAISPRRSAENNEISARINQAVTLLSPRQRTALVLFEMENLSIRQIASIMKLTDGAVKFHLHEARKNMRNSLKSMGIPDSILFEEAPSR